jgi:type II secretory pathway pseudopilin PulG
MSHRSTISTHGYTPFFILHGFEMKVPLDLQHGLLPTYPAGDQNEVARAYHAAINNAYAHARTALDAAHRSQQNAYDRRTHGTGYSAGDPVYLFTPVVKKGTFHKFNSYWSGPHKILQRVTDVDYLIFDREKNRRQLVHYDRLKLARQTGRDKRVENTDDSEHSAAQNSDAARTAERRNSESDVASTPDVVERHEAFEPATPRAVPPRRNNPTPIHKPIQRLTELDASNTRKQTAARTRRAAKTPTVHSTPTPPMTSPEPPRVRGTEERPLRSHIRAPQRFGYNDQPRVPKPKRYAKGPAAFTRLHTFLSVVALIRAMPVPNKAEVPIHKRLVAT